MSVSLTTDTPERPADAGPMQRVSLIVEAIRGHPALMFWFAALSQALLWTLVPALTYPAPPGEVPLVLAVGREWLLGSSFGPPLAYWLAEIAFAAAGYRLIGVYLLSQACVVVTFWAVLALGRSIVGARHAAMAVLLMVGIAYFSLPTPDFGPSVLAMPLTALAFLHTWRAIGEDRRLYWYALGVDLGLLVLTTYAGLMLLALIALFTVATARGRSKLMGIEPWGAGMVVVLLLFPHLVWLDQSGSPFWSALAGLWRLVEADGHVAAWLESVGWLLAAHAAMFLLVAVASGVALPRAPAPAFERAPPDRFAKTFVYCFALVPVLVATLVAGLLGRNASIGSAGPYVVLSGLAVVVAAGDVFRLHGQRVIGRVWLALLLVPPIATGAATIVLPWTLAVDLEVDRPAAAMAQFFTESFRRRTGKPLEIVVGDARLGGLVALASPDRPSLFLERSPELTPWVTEADIRAKGAVVVWPATDTIGTPPESLKARFPDLVPEVRSFVRPVQGRLPLLRIGWAVIRPGVSNQ